MNQPPKENLNLTEEQSPDLLVRETHETEILKSKEEPKCACTKVDYRT